MRAAFVRSLFQPISLTLSRSSSYQPAHVHKTLASSLISTSGFLRSLSTTSNFVSSACARRVYVGNLQWKIRDEELIEHMSKAGPVVSAEVMMQENGWSKGCALVEFETEDGAKNAIKQMTDTILRDRPIFVREDRGEGGKTKGRQLEDQSSRDCRVYVSNLSYRVTSRELRMHFQTAGNVVWAEVRRDNDGRSRGFGMVTFATAEEAKAAIQTLNETELKDRPLFVREDREAKHWRQNPVAEEEPQDGKFL